MPACVLVLAACLVSDRPPLARLGLMSDTHVAAARETCEKVARAYAYFQTQGVDAIVNCGDIADRFLPAAYRNYVDVRRKTYPDPATAPREVFVYAGHDEIGFPPAGRAGETNAYAAVRACLGIANAPWDRFELAGFTFLVFPQFGKEGFGRYEKAIAEACAASPGKPVFVIEHVPGACTTQASNFWGDERRRQILSKYPQVVAVTGHAHGTMYDERNLWQGAYTSVNVAGMTHYRPDAVGVSNASRMSGSVLCADLYADRVVFRRRDIVNDCDCGEPWTLSFGNRETMSFERRFTQENAPAFAEGASLSVECPTNGSACAVEFPAAKGAARAYRLTFCRKATDGWKPFSVREEIADYDMPSSQRKAWWRVIVPRALFDGEGEMRARVEPVGFGAFAGPPIEASFAVPVREHGRTLCATECRKVGGNALLTVPGFSKLSGTVTLVMELSVEQPPDREANLRLSSGKFRLFDKMLTPCGNSSLRYAFDVPLPKKGLSDGLRLTVSGRANVTVGTVRIEKGEP